MVSPMGPFGVISSGGPRGTADRLGGRPTMLAAASGHSLGITAREARESAAGGVAFAAVPVARGTHLMAAQTAARRSLAA